VQSTAKGAVVEGANVKQVCAWNRFQQYLLSIGLQDDTYLDGFNKAQCIKILFAFAHSIREGRYGSKPSIAPIKSESVRASLDSVAWAFRMADQPDPRLDRDQKLAYILQCQLCRFILRSSHKSTSRHDCLHSTYTTPSSPFTF